MRKGSCVPMIALCLLLTACGGKGEETEELRTRYQEMEGCTMEAVVTCDQKGLEWEAQLRCTYVPDGESVVEILAPERVKGIKARVGADTWSLEYQGEVLDIGGLSQEAISPAECLPRMMEALRSGWMLEENDEKWKGIPCRRICLDQSGQQDGEIIAVLWLRLDDGTPLHGEMAVQGENILTAEFTEFSFCDKMEESTKVRASA